jgi:hypothetical protein
VGAVHDARAQVTRVAERFTEHDLRAKVGSDSESLERERQLLGHADAKNHRARLSTQT